MNFKQLQKDVYQNKVNYGFNVTDLNMEFCLAYEKLCEAYRAWLKKKEDLGEELANVAIYLMGIAEILGLDLGEEIEHKIKKNDKRICKNVNGTLIEEEVDMGIDSLKEILDVCDMNDLDSIDILFTHVKKYNLESQKNLLREVQKEKWDKYSSEYEGMNEYDYITIINNFDISTTFDHILLTPYELIFFKKIMEDAIINIKNDNNPLELRIVPNIEEALKEFDIRLNELNNLNDIITDDELEILFNKFDVIELEEFYNVFEYIENYNIERIMDIMSKVHYEKTKEAYSNYEVFIKPYNYNISELSEKRDKLSETELNLLCALLDDAIQSLIGYKQECNATQYEKYNKLEILLSNLFESFSNEFDNRHSKLYKNSIIINEL